MKYFIIPDTQCKPGVPLNHLTAAGNYIVDKQPDVIVHLGDHWDMPSLSSYDKGKRSFEGRRYNLDIEAGLAGMDALLKPIWDYNARQKKKKKAPYKPRKVFIPGNHEDRITRAVDTEAMLHGTIGHQDLRLEDYGWEVTPYLKPIEMDGVWYAHYFHPAHSSQPYGGKASTKLTNIGFSFTMGHQQGKDIAEKHLANGKTLRGLVIGSFYQHDEDYKGPQGNNHWRGCVMKHEVKDGNYCLMELSLDYLVANWL